MEALGKEMLETVIGFLTTHQRYAPLVIFGIMVLEGVLFTTFIFSGTLITIAAGALVQNGTLAYGPVFIAIFAGFWCGDTLNYMLGRTFEDKMRAMNFVLRHQDKLNKAEAFLNKWDGSAIFLSRFMGPTRPFVTLLAGAFHMRPSVFHGATVLSTLILTAGLLNAGSYGLQMLKGLKL